jgi:uncharacterized protein (DUF885 family)
MVTPFAPIAERILDELLAADPVLASYAGDHRFDDRLTDLSSDATTARVGVLRDASVALSGVDDDALDPQDRVDHAQLTSLVEGALFGFEEVREHEWDPLAHNPGMLFHALLSRPFAPIEERLASLAGRLAATPDAMATARSVLRNCPRIHLETAVGQFRGTASFLRSEVPARLAEAPALRDTVEPAATAAIEALEGFADWLNERLEQDGPGRDPRLGRRLWEGKLWHTLDTELGAADVLRMAYQDLERVTSEIEAEAASIGFSDVREALAHLAKDHPDNHTVVDLARATLADTTDFVRAHELVSLVDDECVIQVMPEFARGVAVAYCDPPGPLETAQVPTFYCIAPTPADWSPERVESFYREYNNHMIWNLTIHEAMPGHYLQLAHARRFRAGSTRVRAATMSGTFVEGWAVYAEQVMAEHGFGGVPVRMQQLKMQLRMIINAILDQLTHCEGLAEADAMTLMTGQGFQEEGEAAGKWRRAQLTSTQLSTYYVGYREVSAIGAARPEGTSLQTWHDAMLAHGSPSPRHLRTLLDI